MQRIGLIVEYGVVYGVGLAALALFGAPWWSLALWTLLAFGLLGLLWRRPSACTVVRAASPLVFAAAFVAAYGFIHATPSLQRHILQEVSEYDGEQYYAVISTLFALLTALILVKGIEAFERLNTVIGEEANKIRSIVEFMYYFEEEDGEPVPGIQAVKARTRRIRKLMLLYCDAFLADPLSLDYERANTLLRRATQEVGALDCNDENDRLALGEVMRALNDLFTVRARRVAASRLQIPLYMMIALIFMSLAIIFPFFIGDPAEHPYAEAYIFVLTAFCTFVMLLLRDIDAPFEGFWRVDMHAFYSVRDDLEDWLAHDRERDRPDAAHRPVAAALRRINQ